MNMTDKVAEAIRQLGPKALAHQKKMGWSDSEIRKWSKQIEGHGAPAPEGWYKGAGAKTKAALLAGGAAGIGAVSSDKGKQYLQDKSGLSKKLTDARKYLGFQTDKADFAKSLKKQEDTYKSWSDDKRYHGEMKKKFDPKFDALKKHINPESIKATRSAWGHGQGKLDQWGKSK